ncbi:MAG: hypothetical protein K8H84_06285 [Sulfuricella denitrificans]|nr:hypothetical protein [Sulfuricella denitrificans]
MSKTGHLLRSWKAGVCGRGFVFEAGEFVVKKGILVEDIMNVIGFPFSCHATGIGCLFQGSCCPMLCAFPITVKHGAFSEITKKTG